MNDFIFTLNVFNVVVDVYSTTGRALNSESRGRGFNSSCLQFSFPFISSTLSYSISVIELTEAAVRTCAIQCYTMYIVHIQKCPLENRTDTT